MIVSKRSAFTLIELLVVIAIIAILSVVVILTLNPAELLRQSRDANRLSDISTLNESINVYSTDQSAASTFSMGTPSTTYISIPDPSATSTLGDQCQGLNLPTLPTGYSYHCAASSTYRLTNGTGWIPINFQAISSGSPIGNLPVDPTNASSSNLFYTYTTDGTKYLVTTILESQKYKAQYASNPPITGYPEVVALGSNLSLSELYNPSGLIGWWPLSEGSGTVAVDQSGNGNNGAITGPATGNNGTYYVAGKVGNYAVSMNGSDQILMSSGYSLTGITKIIWIYTSTLASSWATIFDTGTPPPASIYMELGQGSPYILFGAPVTSGGNAFSGQTNEILGAFTLNAWHQIAETITSSSFSAYVDGSLINTLSGTYDLTKAASSSYFGNGRAGARIILNDGRLYNRALSNSEIQALYNAEK